MFTASFFPKVYFTGFYFEPADGATPPTKDENVHIVGMHVNMGTMMGRA